MLEKYFGVSMAHVIEFLALRCFESWGLVPDAMAHRVISSLNCPSHRIVLSRELNYETGWALLALSESGN